jgi:hypothetical protein
MNKTRRRQDVDKMLEKDEVGLYINSDGYSEARANVVISTALYSNTNKFHGNYPSTLQIKIKEFNIAKKNFII